VEGQRRVSQAVGASASSCSEGGRDRRFQKSLPARLDAIGREKSVEPDGIEIWFADEARIGQNNKITRRWARPAKGSGRRNRMEWQDEGKRGTRPSAPQDQRSASTYIFGAICPKEGKGAALILPWCNTEGMALHLKAISAAVAPGRHAALLVDQAGWHLSAKLIVPDNMTIVPLPAKCPELNPQENVWQFMRDN